MNRQATVLVADDMTVSLVGKISLTGIYTSDLVIPINPSIIPQLIFLFRIETAITDLFRRIQLQITLPGESPRALDVPLAPIDPAPEGRTQWYTWQALLIQQAILRPGHIAGKVIHEAGEIEVADLPWIDLAPKPT